MREIFRLRAGAANFAVCGFQEESGSLFHYLCESVKRGKVLTFLYVCLLASHCTSCTSLICSSVHLAFFRARSRPLLTETWFSGEHSGSHTIRCLTFSCDWHLISICTTWIQQQKVKNNHFSHCLITVCCPQANRKPYRVRVCQDRSSCRCTPKNPNCVWHVQTQSCVAATLPALSLSIHFTRRAQLPWCHTPVSFITGQQRRYNERI